MVEEIIKMLKSEVMDDREMAFNILLNHVQVLSPQQKANIAVLFTPSELYFNSLKPDRWKMLKDQRREIIKKFNMEVYVMHAQNMWEKKTFDIQRKSQRL